MLVKQKVPITWAYEVYCDPEPTTRVGEGPGKYWERASWLSWVPYWFQESLGVMRETVPTHRTIDKMTNSTHGDWVTLRVGKHLVWTSGYYYYYYCFPWQWVAEIHPRPQYYYYYHYYHSSSLFLRCHYYYYCPPSPSPEKCPWG